MAITKFRTPNGDVYEGAVVWLDVGKQKIKFVLPFDDYPDCFDLLIHFASGMKVCNIYGRTHRLRRDRAKAALTDVITRHGLKKVRKLLAEAPVINRDEPEAAAKARAIGIEAA
jgi:hypothetical protein